MQLSLARRLTCDDPDDGGGIEQDALTEIIFGVAADPATDHPEQQQQHKHGPDNLQDEGDDGQGAAGHQPRWKPHTYTTWLHQWSGQLGQLRLVHLLRH